MGSDMEISNLSMGMTPILFSLVCIVFPFLYKNEIKKAPKGVFKM